MNEFIFYFISTTVSQTSFSFRQMHSKTPQWILINLCLSLLLLLVAFLCAINLTQNHPVWCTLASHILQFSLLSTFAWMGVQGLCLYKKVVKATRNRGNSPKFFWTCFAFAWGKFPDRSNNFVIAYINKSHCSAK